MIRTTAIVILLVGLVAAQYCPDFQECNSCESGWSKPEITVTDQYVASDRCTVTLSWIYPFTQNDNRTNPRMVFLCSYDDSQSCVQTTEDVCASCQELVIVGVQPSRTPHVTYSDSCGNIDTIQIATNCEQATTPVPIPTTVLTTAPVVVTTTTAPDVVTTTKAPDVVTTATAPDVVTTATAPNVVTTTTAPDVVTTTTAPDVVTTAPQVITTPKVITTPGQVITTPGQVITTTSNPIDCKISFNLVGGRCLLVDSFLNANWDEAQYFCEEVGGHLVSIDNDVLFLAILDYVYANSLENNDYWIGANDTLSDGNFSWLNGSPMEQGTPYWAIYGLGNEQYSQEPTNNGISNYDCVQMDGGRFLYFDDDDCNFSKAAICEERP